MKGGNVPIMLNRHTTQKGGINHLVGSIKKKENYKLFPAVCCVLLQVRSPACTKLYICLLLSYSGDCPLTPQEPAI